MIDRMYYFGCGDGQTGHRLSPSMDFATAKLFQRLDGTLCPPRKAGLYKVAVNRLGGLDVLALAWWDQSVDTREGSNSIVFYPGAESDKNVALRSFMDVYPWAFTRIPVPLTWYTSSIKGAMQ